MQNGFNQSLQKIDQCNFKNLTNRCFDNYLSVDAEVAKMYSDTKLYLPRTIAFVYSNETQSRACHDSWQRFACLKRFPICNPSTKDTGNICQIVCRQYLDNCWWKLTYQSFFYTYKKENGDKFCNQNAENNTAITFCSDSSVKFLNISFILLITLINLF